ncbi:MAG: response regulator [Chloroflexi bacterium]|nr:response regulator [Chloroflexota bacterium]
MAQANSNEAEEKGPQKGLVLVVDDDSRTQRLEKFVLEEEGFPVETVGSGEEALAIINTISPVLILLDVNMPGIDGFTTCQRIREFSQVPIIMVTGENRDEDKVRGLELGADDYVTKPFAIAELAARVKAVLRRYDGGVIPEPLVVPEPPPAPPIDLDVPAPSVDEEVYEGTVKLMIKSAGYIRAMIRFVDELRNNQHFHLLRLTADQRREGMDIWLRLREPMPLRTILLEIEGVSEVAAPNGIDTDSNERQLKVSLG